MLKDKDPYVFVRFGGLQIKRQKGYEKGDWQCSYHSPPAPKGFYSMPKIAQEFFLVGCLSQTQPGIFAKSGDNVIGRKAENPRYWKDRMRQIRKEFRKQEGELWHHLEEFVDRKEILQAHGSWVKTSIRAWAKAFSKMSTIYRYGRHKYDLENGINQHGDGRSIIGPFSRDHCEVFFDSKI